MSSIILATLTYTTLISLSIWTCKNELIAMSTLCAGGTALNIYMCTVISLFFSKQSYNDWKQSISGKRTIYNSIQPMLLIWLSSLFGMKVLDWKYEWNDWNFNLWHWIIMIIGVDIGFYTVHYLFHTVRNLQEKHYYHHECDLKKLGSLCTLDDDYIEAFLRDYLPVLVSSVFCNNFHVFMYNLFYIIYTWWAFYIHSTMNTYHNNHHKYFNCNYGVFYFTDFIFGTFKKD